MLALSYICKSLPQWSTIQNLLFKQAPCFAIALNDWNGQTLAYYYEYVFTRHNFPYPTNGPIKLERFSLASISNLVCCFRVRPESSRVEHMEHLSSFTPNITLGRKGLQGTNILAYKAHYGTIVVNRDLGVIFTTFHFL